MSHMHVFLSSGSFAERKANRMYNNPFVSTIQIHNFIFIHIKYFDRSDSEMWSFLSIEKHVKHSFLQPRAVWWPFDPVMTYGLTGLISCNAHEWWNHASWDAETQETLHISSNIFISSLDLDFASRLMIRVFTFASRKNHCISRQAQFHYVRGRGATATCARWAVLVKGDRCTLVFLFGFWNMHVRLAQEIHFSFWVPALRLATNSWLSFWSELI